jgi:hypothetical protein
MSVAKRKKPPELTFQEHIADFLSAPAQVLEFHLNYPEDGAVRRTAT